MKTQTDRAKQNHPVMPSYLPSLLFWILVWQAAALWLDNSLLLPSPLQTLTVLFTELLVSKAFWLSICNSVFHIALGFLLGLVIGSLLAVLSACSETIHIFLWLPIRLIRSIPVASFVVLALLWTPAGRLSIVISFLMVLPILYTHTLTAIRQLDPKLTEAAVLFRVPVWKRILQLYIPQLLPSVCSACVLASSMAWKSGIAAEIIGLSRNSIGNQLYQAKIYLLTPQLFAWTLVIVLLSIGFEGLLHFLAKLITKL